MRRRTMNLPDSGRGSAGAAGAAEADELNEVLFEFSAVGNSVKVCAIDPDSMVEATIIGPVTAGESALRQAALQKLRYVLTKRRLETDANGRRRYA